MIIVKRVYTRPTPQIPWHYEVMQPDEGWLVRWFHYVGEEKIIKWNYNISEDQLTLNYYSEWESLEAFHEYDHDTEMDPYWAVRDQFNAGVGITVGPKIIGIPNEDGTVREIVLPEGNWDISNII
jgi:hypothetical protein